MYLFIYLFIWKEPCFYVEINENNMHEHRAYGKWNLSFILSL